VHVDRGKMVSSSFGLHGGGSEKKRKQKWKGKPEISSFWCCAFYLAKLRIRTSQMNGKVSWEGQLGHGDVPKRSEA